MVIAIPYIFKDQIKSTIDEQLAANINADVVFDIDNFSLSLLPDFPNLTASIKELGVIGRDEFSGEVLFAIDEFEVEVSLAKLLFDKQMSIQGINLTNPQIFIKVLADGTANYDIVKGSADEDIETPVAEDSDFSIAIENWQISGGHIVYDDATIPVYLELAELNHSGSGNFSLSVFNLKISTEVLLKQVSYDHQNYLSNRHLQMDMILNMDLDNMKFTFKENKVTLNDFSFGFDGWLAMPQDDIDMDISFAASNNSFKSLISLIPAIYTEDFNDLKSSGTVKFDGALKGVYNEESIPAYSVNLSVNEGMFQYPDLPEAVSNVTIDMSVASDNGNIDNTKIDISKFHIEFGRQPFDGFIKIDNLVNYPIDMSIKTTLDLESLSKLFPMEGLQMQGIMKADIKANGVYDSVNSIIPKISAYLSLEKAEIVYADLPAPLSGLDISASIANETGKLNDTKLAVPGFKMNIGDSPVTGALLVENFADYHWEAALEGNLDFTKLFPIINRLYPMPGTEMGGQIGCRFKTEGNMSDLDNERYERLTTSGLLVFNNFTYTDSLYLPQGLILKSGKFTFNPRQLEVKALSLLVGKSDFGLEGIITNYIKYIFNDNENIIGNVSLKSNKIDLNEWMTSEESADVQEEEPATYSVIEVPENIDFVFSADIKQILYDNMVLSNARGKIIVGNGILTLDNLATSTLGGSIVFNGNYNTQDMSKPLFDMALKINNIDIQQSYSAFNTVQALAPVARNIAGKVSSDFSLSGLLQPDMMPDMGTINGRGLVSVKEAELKDSKLVSVLSNYLTGISNESLSLQDIAMDVSITNGRLQVQPFAMKLNNYTTNISGSTGLDGSLDYDIKLDIPAGQVGSQVNALLGSVTGETKDSDIIKLNLGVAGTYDNPKLNLLGTETRDVVKEVAKDVAVKEVVKIAGGDQALADSLINTDVNALVDEQKKAAEAELEKYQDSLKKAAEIEKEKARKKALEEANKQLKNLFGPKKKKKNN
jgi:AsmA-like C-terminal region